MSVSSASMPKVPGKKKPARGEFRHVVNQQCTAKPVDGAGKPMAMKWKTVGSLKSKFSVPDLYNLLMSACCPVHPAVNVRRKLKSKALSQIGRNSQSNAQEALTMSTSLPSTNHNPHPDHPSIPAQVIKKMKIWMRYQRMVSKHRVLLMRMKMK